MAKKAYLYFWLTGLVIAVYQVTNPNGYKSPFQNPTIDLDVPTIDHGFEHSFTIIGIILFFTIVGFGYWFIEKKNIKLNQRATKLHLILTLGITWLIWIFVIYSLYFPVKYSRLSESSFFEFFSLICSGLILIAQIIFLINFVLGIRNKKSISE